jgi:hypothetical protein
MRRSIARLLAASTVLAGVGAGAAAVAPAASAATDTSGTVAITLPDSYVAQLAKAGVVEFPVPLSELSADSSAKTVTVTFTVTGGNADERADFGSLDLSGTVDVVDANGNTLTLGTLQLNLRAGTISAVPAGGTTAVPLLDLGGGGTAGPGSTTQTLTEPGLLIDPAGATYVNNALDTTAFTAGQNIGSLAATWTITTP